MLINQVRFVYLRSIFPSEIYVSQGEVAIVNVQAKITGRFDDVESDSVFRFTRVWVRPSDVGWQVISGHSSMVV